LCQSAFKNNLNSSFSEYNSNTFLLLIGVKSDKIKDKT